MAIKRFNIRISEELHEFFAQKSEKTGVSMSSLMALALEEYKMQRDVVDMVSKIERLEKLEKEGKKGDVPNWLKGGEG